jgi:hypothetical protein
VKCPLFERTDVETEPAKGVAMLYAAAVVERAMKMQEVILRVLSGA